MKYTRGNPSLSVIARVVLAALALLHHSECQAEPEISMPQIIVIPEVPYSELWVQDKFEFSARISVGEDGVPVPDLIKLFEPDSTESQEKYLYFAVAARRALLLWRFGPMKVSESPRNSGYHFRVLFSRDDRGSCSIEIQDSSKSIDLVLRGIKIPNLKIGTLYEENIEGELFTPIGDNVKDAPDGILPD